MRHRWREERKRHYPTDKRVSEKEEAKKALQEAGALEPEEKRLKLSEPEKTMVKLQVGERVSGDGKGKRVALCQNYLRGCCKFGAKCKLLHDPCRKNKSLCKAFIRGYCARVRHEWRRKAKGMNCKKIHSPSDRLVWLKQSMVEVSVRRRCEG